MIAVYLFGFFVLLLLLSVYAATLIILRARLFATTLYRPMLINIGLAWLPLVILGIGGIILLMLGSWLPDARLLSTSLLAIFLVLYGLAFPNATYLITELNFSHRTASQHVPIWYDIIQTLTLTLVGILTGLFTLTIVHLIAVFSLVDVNQVGQISSAPLLSWVIIYAYILLSNFGIYLGRHVRVNSWDVMHPIKFMKRLADHFKVKEHRHTAIGYVVTFSILLGLLHTALFLLVIKLLG